MHVVKLSIQRKQKLLNEGHYSAWINESCINSLGGGGFLGILGHQQCQSIAALIKSYYVRMLDLLVKFHKVVKFININSP